MRVLFELEEKKEGSEVNINYILSVLGHQVLLEDLNWKASISVGGARTLSWTYEDEILPA
ncbi:MAG: hypothetical protein ACI959_001011 [Limisphaerales bacterium]|jgi:hypothetical protein